MVAKLLDGTPVNVGVYKAYRNAGLSHNQAMAITAEVGRENSFNPSVLFGTHPDPARDKNGNIIRNVGMLSWNQGRDTQALNAMRNAGVLGQQSQANLNAQAAFSVREMLTGYKGKLRNFLNNPNGSPEQFAQELGRNYIVWAYGQNTIAAKVVDEYLLTGKNTIHGEGTIYLLSLVCLAIKVTHPKAAGKLHRSQLLGHGMNL